MLETPRLTTLPETHYAAVHVVCPRPEISKVMGPGIGEVMGTIASQGLAPTGPWFTHHLRITKEAFDFEICVPVARAVSPAGRVKPAHRPELPVVQAIYRGPYEGLGAAWAEFDAFAEKNGVPNPGECDLWEIYLKGPESGPDASQYETQLNRARR